MNAGGAPDRSRLALSILRVAVAVLLVIHGATRVWLRGVAPFGDFLQGQGIPAGHALAWALTVVELAGGALLALGRFVVPLCAWFGLELACGILLVHWRQGWFVVGAGRSGMEYSVLLIVVLAAVALAQPRLAGSREQTG